MRGFFDGHDPFWFFYKLDLGGGKGGLFFVGFQPEFLPRNLTAVRNNFNRLESGIIIKLLFVRGSRGVNSENLFNSCNLSTCQLENIDNVKFR